RVKETLATAAAASSGRFHGATGSGHSEADKPAPPHTGRARSSRAGGLRRACCGFWNPLFHGVSRNDFAHRRFGGHWRFVFHRLEAHLHPSGESAGTARRHRRGNSASGTELRARAVAPIAVGFVVVFAPADNWLTDRHV